MGVLGDGDEPGEVRVGLRRVAPGEELAGGLGLHLREAQHLAEAVVQLAGEPVPLPERGEGALRARASAPAPASAR